MGVNFLRTAHYPQDRALVEACDRLGILVSMEIPLDHDIRDTPEFYENTNRMMVELIRQYYNHPSIIIWAYMNEMFLGKRLPRDSVYVKQVVDYARILERLTRDEDPSRYTMIPNHGDLKIYQESGITQIPMIVGWNLYYGWYEPDLEGLGKFVDEAHRQQSDKPIIITEYGAGADPRLRSVKPVRFDFSLDWQLMFHSANFREILKRPFVAASAVWNMYDFGSEGRNDAVPKINSKGLCSFDRIPKPSYYVYQTYLAEGDKAKIIEPVRINKDSIRVMAVSNQQLAGLWLNEERYSPVTVMDQISTWDLAWESGPVSLQVKSVEGDVLDDMKWEFTESKDKSFWNFGAELIFRDDFTGHQWLPAHQFGMELEGQKHYRKRDRGIGTDRDILGTDQDPLFQTQTELTSLRKELPAGHYQLEFLFCELENKVAGDRLFSVTVNGKTLIRNIDLARDAGRFVALRKKVSLQHKGGLLEINFDPVNGIPVLNGLSVQRNF
jgi:beta-galactosidase